MLDLMCPESLRKTSVVTIGQSANSEASFEEELNFVQLFFFFFCNIHQ